MMLNGKKIMVTGGSGFVGTKLIKRLFDFDVEITSVLHKNVSRIHDHRIKYKWLDLTIPDNYLGLMKDVDYVVMCAANTSGAAVIEETPLAHVTPNVIMNSLALESAHKAGVKKFIFISSNTVYPPVEYAVKEDDIKDGIFFDKYYCVATMKSFCEKLCYMYSNKIRNPMATIVVRPANLFGPHDNFNRETSHVIPSLIRKVVEKHDPIEVWGDGKDVKDFLYIDDFIDALILILENVEEYDIFNVASGRSISLNKILENIMTIEGVPHYKINYNMEKPTMIPKRMIDITKATVSLGFYPKTSLESGLKTTIEWYKKNRD